MAVKEAGWNVELGGSGNWEWAGVCSEMAWRFGTRGDGSCGRAAVMNIGVWEKWKRGCSVMIWEGVTGVFAVGNGRWWRRTGYGVWSFLRRCLGAMEWGREGKRLGGLQGGGWRSGPTVISMVFCFVFGLWGMVAMAAVLELEGRGDVKRWNE
ncbi:unnamed protein product [Calypogeia fissa]